MSTFTVPELQLHEGEVSRCMPVSQQRYTEKISTETEDRTIDMSAT
jgi:hypothetical protein